MEFFVGEWRNAQNGRSEPTALMSLSVPEADVAVDALLMGGSITTADPNIRMEQMALGIIAAGERNRLLERVVAETGTNDGVTVTGLYEEYPERAQHKLLQGLGRYLMGYDDPANYVFDVPITGKALVALGGSLERDMVIDEMDLRMSVPELVGFGDQLPTDERQQELDRLTGLASAIAIRRTMHGQVTELLEAAALKVEFDSLMRFNGLIQ